jgi:DNA-binding LytR/AlgR family response regulator
MEVEIKIDPTCKKPKIIIVTNEASKEINELTKKLSGIEYSNLTGFKGDEILLIKPEEISRIYTEGQKVAAQINNEKVYLKYRLYELEERLSGTSFIRISNSEIVNFDRVKSLDMSVSGTITLKLMNGEKSFVSRRFIDKIKKYLELK